MMVEEKGWKKRKGGRRGKVDEEEGLMKRKGG